MTTMIDDTENTVPETTPEPEAEANEFDELIEHHETGQDAEFEEQDDEPIVPEEKAEEGEPEAEPEPEPEPEEATDTAGEEPEPSEPPSEEIAQEKAVSPPLTQEQLQMAMAQMGLTPQMLQGLQQQQAAQQQHVQREQMGQQRTDAVKQLKDLYAISEEQAADFLQKPEEILPELLANLHMTVVEQALSNVAAYLPSAVQQHQQTANVDAQLQEEFYGMFPNLQDEKFDQTVLSMARSLLDSGQRLPKEDFMKQLGVAASLSLGVELPEAYGTQKAEAAPADKPQPFTPANRQQGAGSAGTGETPKKSEGNEFTVLSEHYHDLI